MHLRKYCNKVSLYEEDENNFEDIQATYINCLQRNFFSIC